jgi:hypothetical protein
MKCNGSLRSVNGKIHNFKKKTKYPPKSLQHGRQSMSGSLYLTTKCRHFFFLRNATYHHLCVNKIFVVEIVRYLWKHTDC